MYRLVYALNNTVYFVSFQIGDQEDFKAHRRTCVHSCKYYAFYLFMHANAWGVCICVYACGNLQVCA